MPIPEGFEVVAETEGSVAGYYRGKPRIWLKADSYFYRYQICRFPISGKPTHIVHNGVWIKSFNEVPKEVDKLINLLRQYNGNRRKNTVHLQEIPGIIAKTILDGQFIKTNVGKFKAPGGEITSVVSVLYSDKVILAVKNKGRYTRQTKMTMSYIWDTENYFEITERFGQITLIHDDILLLTNFTLERKACLTGFELAVLFAFTNNHTPWLNAFRESDDGVVHLVYADYLEEKGNPQCDLIRKLCSNDNRRDRQVD